MKDEIENIKHFLKTHGRLKYLKALYIPWIKLDFNGSKIFFEENKLLYHPLARRLIGNNFESLKDK